MVEAVRAPAAATAQGPRKSDQQSSSIDPKDNASNGHAQAEPAEGASADIANIIIESMLAKGGNADIDSVLDAIAGTEHFETRSKKGRGMARRSLDLIEAMYAAGKAAQPITGRGIGYKLFTAGLIPSMARGGRHHQPRRRASSAGSRDRSPTRNHHADS
jgi:hypothetical protein